jgi:hypothetical protein
VKQQQDAARIRSRGGVPLVAALLEQHGDSVCLLVTTVAAATPTLHSNPQFGIEMSCDGYRGSLLRWSRFSRADLP